MGCNYIWRSIELEISQQMHDMTRQKLYVELYLLEIEIGKLDQKVFQLIVRTEGCF